MDLGVGFTIFLFLILLVLIIFMFFVPKKCGDNESSNEEREVTTSGGNVVNRNQGFGIWEPVTNDSHGTCGVYTFESSTQNTIDLEPTFNLEILDNMDPTQISDLTIKCLDENQLAAYKAERVCEENICVGLNGVQYRNGEVETAYRDCSELADKRNCSVGTNLDLLIINFTPFTEISDLSCITSNSTLTDPFVSECGLNNQGQIFRVQRFNLNVKTNELEPDSNGIYAKIINRASGQCLVSAVKNPDSGASLVFGKCSPNKGIVWILVPPMSISSPLSTTTTTSPQQIVYTDTVNYPSLKEIHSNVENGILPLVLQQNGSNLILAPFVIDKSLSIASKSLIQFVNYSIVKVFQETPTYPNLGINIPFLII